MADKYVPTKEMQEEAKRALQWKAEGKKGGTRVGLARANQIAKRENLSLDTVKRMYSFFSRHEVNKKTEGFAPNDKGYPNPARVAWGLWGGDAGYKWSEGIWTAAKEKETNKGYFMENVIHREFALIKKDGYEEAGEGMEKESDGIYSFVVSTPDVDRYGTVIVPNGINYMSYMKNPVVLLNHKSEYLPIGKCLGFFLNGENLEATIQLDLEDEKACKIDSKLNRGFMSAVSVGIMPIETEEQTIDGEKVTVYTKSELVEFSVVTIPANRDALIKKNFEKQQLKSYEQILLQLNQKVERMLTPEQTAAIQEQLLPVIKEAALIFFKEQLGLPEDLATEAADLGTIAMAEKVMEVLNPEDTAEPAPQTTEQPEQTSTQTTESVQTASYEERAGRKISASTLAQIMEGMQMVDEGNKKIKKAVNTERGFEINIPKVLTANEIMQSIKGNNNE
ncbi:MAG: HK97 family phage prohead protease [Methylophilaceae bacterium]